MQKSKQNLAPRDGSLIVVEGVDGSGKTTQLHLMARFLESNGFAVMMTEWTGSPTMKPLLKKIKNRTQPIRVSPYVFSLLHAADLAERTGRIINDALKAGIIVLADRYVYTAYTRDAARGLESKWLKQVYTFAPPPDLTFYFRVTPEVAISRKIGMPKFHESGMDLGLSDNPMKSFEIFQTRIIAEYEKLIDPYKFVVMDGSDKIYNTFAKVKQKLVHFIKSKYNVTLL